MKNLGRMITLILSIFSIIYITQYNIFYGLAFLLFTIVIQIIFSKVVKRLSLKEAIFYGNIPAYITLIYIICTNYKIYSNIDLWWQKDKEQYTSAVSIVQEIINDYDKYHISNDFSSLVSQDGEKSIEIADNIKDEVKYITAGGNSNVIIYKKDEDVYIDYGEYHVILIVHTKEDKKPKIDGYKVYKIDNNWYRADRKI